MSNSLNAVVIVRGATIVNRQNKAGETKRQLEVTVDDGKLQTFNLSLLGPAEQLVGCYAAVEYREKQKPYPGEWLLDSIRAATDEEADAYSNGSALRLGKGLTYEQAISAPSASAPPVQAPAATTAPQAAPAAAAPATSSAPAVSGPSAAGGASKDEIIAAECAAKIALGLWEAGSLSTIGESGSDAAIKAAELIKALTVVLVGGAKDDGDLATLAAVLGADEMTAFAYLNQLGLKGTADEAGAEGEAMASSSSPARVGEAYLEPAGPDDDDVIFHDPKAAVAGAVA